MTERVTAALLKFQGWEILARNLRTPHAEIDLLCADESGLVIVEVKYRSSELSDPVSFQQRTRLARSASWLLGQLSYADLLRKKGIRNHTIDSKLGKLAKQLCLHDHLDYVVQKKQIYANGQLLHANVWK